MSGSTTRVTAVIAAQVTGTEDLQALAKQLDKLPDQTSTEVAAKVSGTQELDGLTKDLAALPSQTSTEVRASVTGDQLVAGLTSDLQAIPASTTAKVAASVTGDADVATLTSDLHGLPATTSTEVDTTLTGDQQLDALVSKLAAVPKNTSLTVTANIKETGAKGGVKELGDDIDKVKTKAGSLGVEGAAFASQFLGPFSNGVGVFGDLAEQLRNLGGETEEAGSKFKAFASVGAGIGIGIVAGIGIDAISKVLAESGRIMQEHTSDVAALVASYGTIGPAATEAARATAYATLTGEDAGRKVLAWAKANGVAASEVVDAFLGLPSGDEVKGKILAWNAAGQNVTGLQQLGLGISNIVGAAPGVSAALKGTQTEVSNLFGVSADAATAWETQTEAIKGTTAATVYLGAQIGPVDAATQALNAQNALSATQQAETAVAATAYAQALKDQGAANAQAAAAALQASQAAATQAVAQDGVSTALADTQAASDAAKRSLDFLQVTLDKLAGRDRTAEQAAADYNSALLGLKNAAKDAKDGKDLDRKALAAWNVAALTASKSGQEVYQSLNQLADGYSEVVDATYEHEAATKGSSKAMADARAAADTARASFIKNAEQLGLNSKQAAGLADKLGILAGKDIPDKAFKIIADDKDAKAKADALAAKKIDPKSFTIGANDQNAQTVLAALKSQPVADKVAKIIGDATSYTTKVAELKAIGIPDKQAKIIANADNLEEAQADIQAVADADYKASIVVHFKAANQTQANLINYAFPGANVGTRSVAPPGLGAEQQDAEVGATSAASAARAPGLRSPSVSIGVPLPTYSITINGAVDKDATARALERILDQRARRIGPTVLGRPRALA